MPKKTPPTPEPREEIWLDEAMRTWYKAEFGENWMSAMSDVLRLYMSNARLQDHWRRLKKVNQIGK